MTKERMPMFQRKPILHENDNKQKHMQERQHDDIKSQMETATDINESMSPSESWISKG